MGCRSLCLTRWCVRGPFSRRGVSCLSPTNIPQASRTRRSRAARAAVCAPAPSRCALPSHTRSAPRVSSSTVPARTELFRVDTGSKKGTLEYLLPFVSTALRFKLLVMSAPPPIVPLLSLAPRSFSAASAAELGSAACPALCPAAERRQRCPTLG